MQYVALDDISICRAIGIPLGPSSDATLGLVASIGMPLYLDYPHLSEVQPAQLVVLGRRAMHLFTLYEL